MAVTNYYSLEDGIIGEETSGTRRDYLTDALGSVTATVTSAGAIENTYRYKPYGETLVKTGTGSDPKFLWVGTWGYRTGSSSGTFYVRARTYYGLMGRWTSLDPIQSGDNWYAYCDNNPVNFIDPEGLKKWAWWVTVEEFWLHTILKKPRPKPKPDLVSELEGWKPTPPSKPEPAKPLDPQSQIYLDNHYRAQEQARLAYEESRRPKIDPPEHMILTPFVPINYPKPNDNIPKPIKVLIDWFFPQPPISPDDVIGVTQQYIDPNVQKLRERYVNYLNKQAGD